MKATLTQSQDKAIRRISELREQSQLDGQAKRDLEQNYTLMLEEKDELNRVLKLQVRSRESCTYSYFRDGNHSEMALVLSSERNSNYVMIGRRHFDQEAQK